MKKVLVLSCSTGQGHNSCAQAMKEYFEQQQISCEIQDAIGFSSRQLAQFMSWGHSFVYRHMPGFFRWGYRQSELHPAFFQEGSPVYRVLTSGAERLYQYLIAEEFDTVICTHTFADLILTHVLNQHPLSIQTAFIATDYTCYPGTNACGLQNYFIADAVITDRFVQMGIPKARIQAVGIPVRRAFYKKTERADAKRLLNIHADSRHLLIMCGSMGCGPITRIVKQIAKNMPRDTEVSVICGRNKRLFQSLSKRYQKRAEIHIVSYTNQMSLYLDSADLCLTKPGGISVAEASVKGLPMAFIDAVAGCETYNMEHFIKMGAAITARSPKKLAQKSLALLEDTQELQHMRAAMQAHPFPDSAAQITESLEERSSKCQIRNPKWLTTESFAFTTGIRQSFNT